MFGGGDDDVLGRISMMTAQMLSPTAEISSPPSKERGGGSQQQPQWGQQETKELIGIRAELEKDSAIAKRSKTLWEIVSAKMRDKGFRRTPEQCKCKWKNLVNRYKGKETSDPEHGRHCPFFEELHAVFTERARNMQRLLLESETGSTQARKRLKRLGGDRTSDEFSEDEDYGEDYSEVERSLKSNSRKRKGERIAEKSPRATGASSSHNSTVDDIHDMLREFLRQQQKMEMQWREMMERRNQERQLFDQEWRQTMENLERETLKTEQAWREKEEERRIREESRAERRDALLTALLKKLIHENNM